jgi:hypothetical protein
MNKESKEESFFKESNVNLRKLDIKNKNGSLIKKIGINPKYNIKK